MTKTQSCSTPGCGNFAAFTTRSKPAWCAACLDRILHRGGLRPDEPFKGPTAWWLTTCLTCGVQAHYRLEYIVGNSAKGEKTCRACHWKSWARDGRQLIEHHVLDGELRAEADEQFELPRGWSRKEIRSAVEENGYELIEMTAELTGDDGHHTMVVRCTSCHRISVKRLGDIGWGCNCSRNQNRSSFEGRAVQRVLLKNSDSKALRWWDHQRNITSDFDTTTVNATRTCHWICPDCGTCFQEKVSEMTRSADCPDCAARRRQGWAAEYERWKRTPVSEVAELLAAWADDADPRQVMVAGGFELRRFRCRNGHHPRVSPLTFMDNGCPSCTAQATAKKPLHLADVDPEVSSQWHPTLNGKLDPHNVVSDSKRVIWWHADCCGYEWQERVRDRNKYQRWLCPQCRTILDSLAWHDPGLAAEWNPTNPTSPWKVRPTASTSFLPEWICSVDVTHVWQAPLASRSSGAECPECRQVGKSRIELDYHTAATELFGQARSGILLRDNAFTFAQSGPPTSRSR